MKKPIVYSAFLALFFVSPVVAHHTSESRHQSLKKYLAESLGEEKVREVLPQQIRECSPLEVTPNSELTEYDKAAKAMFLSEGGVCLDKNRRLFPRLSEKEREKLKVRLERKLSLADSFPRAANFYRRHAALLAKGELEYGVDAFSGMCVVLIETDLGNNFGEHSVVMYLYNTWMSPRWSLKKRNAARTRLRIFLKFAEANKWDVFTSYGSHEGAHGWTQFLPSNDSYTMLSMLTVVV